MNATWSYNTTIYSYIKLDRQIYIDVTITRHYSLPREHDGWRVSTNAINANKCLEAFVGPRFETSDDVVNAGRNTIMQTNENFLSSQVKSKVSKSYDTVMLSSQLLYSSLDGFAYGEILQISFFHVCCPRVSYSCSDVAEMLAMALRSSDYEYCSPSKKQGDYIFRQIIFNLLVLIKMNIR